MVTMLLLSGWHTLQAQGPQPFPPALDTSSKSVDKEMAQPGETLSYEIVVHNSGDDPALGVALTDTLPSEVTYVPNTLTAESGIFGESNGVITWEGVLNANGDEITVSFDAILTDTVESGTVLTNSVVITGSGVAFTRVATTTVYTTSGSILYMPMINRGYPVPSTPSLSLAGRPSPTNEWTLAWTIANEEYVDEYEIMEAENPDFSDGTIIGTSSTKQFTVDKPLLKQNILYYRVRGLGPGGTGFWSNSYQVIAGYRDDFNSAGDWEIRRQDTDDTENYSYYENGHYVLEIDGQWDYAIGAPMQPAPEPPYRIETSAYLAEPDNLNTYGIIFGGSWDGVSECPGDDYRGCLDHYYRLILIWFGSPDHMSVQLKRIDYHDSNNSGRGEVELIEGIFRVGVPPAGYQRWAVEVHADGTIRLFNGEELLATAQDTEYINEPYFGVFAATDEYLGAEPHFDWYQVKRMP